MIDLGPCDWDTDLCDLLTAVVVVVALAVAMFVLR